MLKTVLRIFVLLPAFLLGACAIFSPDRAALKNLPAPDTLCVARENRKVISPDEGKWQAWLADFSERNFSPSIATYAPGEAMFYGNGFSINFHEKSIVLNFDGEQYVCERVPADTEFLNFAEKQSRTAQNLVFRPLY
ncbi:MAG: hypothetical protein IKM45_01615 [Opitutales bacterium]|nr:hypothetical protein [Opitutales bacterium]